MEAKSSQAQPARSSQAQFDRQAPHYDAQWDAWNRESLEWMLNRSEASETDTALDIATGAGFMALALAKLVRKVAAIDVSTGMLEQGRNRALEQGIDSVAFSIAQAEALPFDDGGFDIVTCRIAAHHFVDVRAFVRESARVLRPGGRFVIADTSVPDGEPQASDWQNEVEIARDPSHVRNYTPKEWRDLVEAAGLVIVEELSVGGGITIPLTDWMIKSGCTPAQETVVRAAFENAPESARRIFDIGETEAGETIFTWRRVLLKAIKP